jgi:hypothetical protein
VSLYCRAGGIWKDEKGIYFFYNQTEGSTMTKQQDTEYQQDSGDAADEDNPAESPAS